MSERAILRVGGMHCASCVAQVEKALAAVPGVSGVEVNLATEKAIVQLEAWPETDERFALALRGAGYSLVHLSRPSSQSGRASLRDDADADRAARAEARANDIRLALAAPLALVLFLGGHASLIRADLSLDPRLQFALALPVQFYCGWPFLASAWAALRRGSSDMNSLIAASTLSAFLVSVIATFFPQLLPQVGDHTSHHAPIYFETASTIITLILLGRRLEGGARARAGAAVRRLIELQPRRAIRIERGGASGAEEEREISIDEVRVGDELVVRPGQRVPVDGELLAGHSSIDESMLTGEAVPVEKGPGSPVYAGTLNRVGAFRFLAQKIGSEMVLGQIVELVSIAQAGKAPIQRLADRIAAVFVPIVFAIAALTFAVWMVAGGAPGFGFALLAAVSVLVIACPCALGLATPAAIAVGTGVGAERGILWKGGGPLERTHAIDTVVFDKTGTLTRGRPALEEIESSDRWSMLELLSLAASAESRSEHPIGQAIVAAARTNEVEVSEPSRFEAVPGGGIEARLAAGLVRVGSAAFLREAGVTLRVGSDDFEARAAELARDGRIVVLVAVDQEVAGLVTLADPTREEARHAVDELRALGIRVVLLTGDAEGTARRVAIELGIDDVRAERRPAGKLAEIRTLQSEGLVVAMVGDGINDAPALAQADVGVAIGAGADVALEAGDVTLVRDDLRAVPESLRLARQTFRVIRQNLAWAFGWNALGIPLAAGALYPAFGWTLNPMLAAVAMSASSLIVLSNALRLRRAANS